MMRPLTLGPQRAIGMRRMTFYMVLVTFSVGPPLPDDLDLPLTLRHGVPQATPLDAARPSVVPPGHVELEGVEESPGHVV